MKDSEKLMKYIFFGNFHKKSEHNYHASNGS